MNGIVLLDKPYGRTSFEAVRAVSRIYGHEKAGHSGTLDPAATGVLPVFLGRATKLISLLPDTDKSYTAEVRLGEKTDTGDADGVTVAVTDHIPTENQLLEALPGFTGDILQIPPMYSAKKINGVPMYKLAREGKEAERRPCAVSVRSIEISGYDGVSFNLSVECSSGTYIRTLAEDLAEACGSLCHLTSLRRTSACGFRIGECLTPEQLSSLKESGREWDVVADCERPFMCCPVLKLDGDLLRLFMNGFRFPAKRAGADFGPGCMLRIYAGGSFSALGRIDCELQLEKIWQASVY